MIYGLTEVFVKHEYYSSLRIKLVKRVGDLLMLHQYLGDRVEEMYAIETTKKLYPIQKGMFQIELSDEFFYLYEGGEHSFLRYKYIKHVGSSRSSKSWSIEESIIRKCEQNDAFRVTCWRDTKSSLGESVWKDFRKIFPLSGRPYKFPQNTIPIFFPNGSTIEPHGDDTTNAHGVTQNIAWLNEPYKMTEETFNQIDQRADQIIIDINPSGAHWSDKLDKNPRCKIIHSTFQDNPFCPIEMKLKILSYNPDNPINVSNGTADAYMWSVYGLGMKAEKPHRIYKGWQKISVEEYEAIQAKEYVGNDWGKHDPWAVGKAKYHDGALYLRELNYLSENDIRKTLSEEDLVKVHQLDEGKTIDEQVGIVSYQFSKLGIDKKSVILCDSNRPLKIAWLRRNGWHNATPANKVKGSIVDGIELVQNLRVFYTEDSTNIEIEHENYSYACDRMGVTDEPEDKDNHHMDWIRYVALYLRANEIIKLV